MSHAAFTEFATRASRIRVRLILMAVSLALPFAGYSTYVAIDDAAAEQVNVGQELYGRAQVVAARLDDHVNDIRAILSVISTKVSIDAARISQNDDLLRGIASQLPAHVDNLTVWTLDGLNIGSIDPTLQGATYPRVPLASLFPAEFPDGVSSMRVQAPVPSSAAPGSLIAVFRYPILRKGHLVGAVGATMKLSSLQDLLATGSKLAPEAVMSIVTDDNVILARSIDPRRWVGQVVKGPASGVAGGRADAEGVRNGRSADGVERMGALALAHAAPWKVYVGVPKDVALHPVYARLSGHLVTALTVLVLGMGLAIVIGGSIVSPLRQLIDDAHRFGGGDLQHRSEVRTRSEVGTLVKTLNDMAEQLQQRSASLAQSERRLQMIADNVPAMVTYVDRQERYRFANAFLGEVFGTAPEAILGRTMREAGGAKLYADIAPHVAAALRGERVVFEGDWVVSGRRYSYQSTYVPDVGSGGAIEGFYAMTFDITALKQTQNELDQLARRDALTGLPNRREFAERLDAAMARCRRSRRTMALVFLDVDRFKQINDTFGHGAGDSVLVQFADRLVRSVRATDTVARLAGDEFVIILEGLQDPSEVELVSQKLGAAIRVPMRSGDSVLDVTASIGVAVYDGVDGSSKGLVASADRALYRAKKAGRDTYAATNFAELA